MKLTFAPEDRTQAAVAAQQIELRRARPKRYPIGRWLVGALALAAVVVAIWWWLTATRIYSYGVVETGFEVFHAPVRSRVSSVLVGPGDRVKADQVLYVLASEDGQAQLTVTEEELSQQRRILEGALAEREVLFDDPAQELRDLGEARTRLAELEREVVGLTLTSAIITQDLQREVEASARRAAFLAEGSATADAARERMQALRDLDAATGSEVRAAEESARQAGPRAGNGYVARAPSPSPRPWRRRRRPCPAQPPVPPAPAWPWRRRSRRSGAPSRRIPRPRHCRARLRSPPRFTPVFNAQLRRARGINSILFLHSPGGPGGATLATLGRNEADG